MRKQRVTTIKKAYIYIRVSTGRQAESGLGLEAQEAQCRNHAARLGLDVQQVFVDTTTARVDNISNRPALEELYKLAGGDPEAVVIVYSISRLARRQKTFWQLLDEKTGFAVSSATESFDTSTPTGRAMLGMLAVFAQLEGDMISERTKDALAAAKAQGRELGAKSSAKLAPETVELVKKLYASGNYSHRSLAAHLNNIQQPTPTGKGSWHLRQIQRLLTMPTS